MWYALPFLPLVAAEAGVMGESAPSAPRVYWETLLPSAFAT